MSSKRTIDVIVAATLLVVLAPLLGAVALLILLFLGWPVLFVQERPGFEGRLFRIVKFRTMQPPRSESSTDTDAERMRGFGACLRRTSLDELPELWNVLRGDMSLIGPRPLLKEYLPLYTAEQMRRHSVRPGITGWAQVNGRNAISWEQRFALDLWYIDHWTWSLDLRILWMTIANVIRGDGVAQVGQVTVERFTGTMR